MATVTGTNERISISNSPFVLSSLAGSLFVLGTWALLFVGALACVWLLLSAVAYVWKFSHAIPMYDDYQCGD